MQKRDVNVEVELPCDNCKEKFWFPDSVIDYGITFLRGPETSYVVVLCPKCKKSTYVKLPTERAERLHTKLNEFQNQISKQPELVYDSFPYYVYENQFTPSLIHWNDLSDTDDKSIEKDELFDIYSKYPSLESDFHAYGYGDRAIGPMIAITLFDDKKFTEALRQENITGIRCIPRYIVYNTALENVYQFCWKHRICHDYLKQAIPKDEEGNTLFKITGYDKEELQRFLTADFLDILELINDPQAGLGIDDRLGEEFRLGKYTNTIAKCWANRKDKEVDSALRELAIEFIDDFIPLQQKLDFKNYDLNQFLLAYLEKLQKRADPIKLKKVVNYAEEEKDKKESLASYLIRLVRAKGKLFQTTNREQFVRIEVGDHEEVLNIHSDKESDAAKWIKRIYYEETGSAAKTLAVKDALGTLESLECPIQEVFVRLAQSDDAIYLDLANEKWEQVKIDKTGWAVIQSKDSPILFKRSRGMKPLPYPKAGGSLEDLKRFINIEDNDYDSWVLIVSWIIGALNPEGPFPILILQGEHGTAKTSISRFLNDLIDPSSALVRTPPTKIRDLAISAENSWILAYDNLSSLSPQFSDAFCRLSTGGGFATRELYSDKNEIIFDAKRPMIFNGITDIAVRHDLADRSLIVNLQPISEEERKREKELWGVWYEQKPIILGYFLNVISAALKNLDNVKVDRLPRMADFAYWIASAEYYLPWEHGTFFSAYKASREYLIESAIEAHPVATAILDMMKERDEWSGMARDLLTILNQTTDPAISRSREWPKKANVLSRRIMEASSFLRTRGVEVERGKSGDRNITIRKIDSSEPQGEPEPQDPFEGVQYVEE